MGKKVTTAIGTEMQFMPQPDKDYEERVNQVEGVKGSNTGGVSSIEMMANSLKDLNGSWLNFINSHDKRWEDYTMSKAQDLINGASDDDIKKLTAVDLAQTYGYGTLADNGYFKAFSSKLRGQRLSDMAKTAYYDKYGDNPLPIDKEESRYTQFMEDFKDHLNMDELNENNTAFDAGYSSNNAKNAADLANSIASRDVADRKDTTSKEVMSQLSQYGANGMLKDKPEVAAQRVNQICNQMKLGGLDPSTRTDIMDRFCQEVMSRGVIKNPEDWYKFEKSVMVQTNLDGSQTSLFDLRDRLADSKAILDYNKAHLSQLKMTFANKYKNDPTSDRAKSDVLKLLNSTSLEDRDKGQILEGMLPSLFSTQSRARAGRASGRVIGGGKAAVAVAQQQAKHDLVHDNIMAYLNNGSSETDEHGNLIGNVKLSDGKGASAIDYYNGFCEVRNDIENNENLSEADKNKQIMKLYEYAGMSPIAKGVMSQLCNTAQQETPEDIDNNGIEPWLIRADEARRTDPVTFKNAYGDKFDGIIQQIQNFMPSEVSDRNNALAVGYKKYLAAHRVDKQTYEDNMKQCVNDTKAMNIEDAVALDGTENNIVDVTDPQIAGKFRDSAVLYLNSGMDSTSAYQLAMQDIKSSYTYCHGAYFPDSYLQTSGVDNLSHNASVAFDLLANQYGGWDNVRMRYNPNTDETTLIENDGTIHTMSQDAVMNEIRAVPYMEEQLAQQQAEAQTKSGQTYMYQRTKNEGKGEGLSNNAVDTNEEGYSSFNSLKGVSDEDNTAGGKYIY